VKKKGYFKTTSKDVILCRNDSLKRAFFFTGLGFAIPACVPAVANLLVTGDAGLDSGSIITVPFFILGSGLLIASFYFRPVYTIFNRSRGLVTFQSSKLTFDVPFSSIRFVSNRLLSTKGSSIVVSVYAVSDKPSHAGQKITNPDKPADHYETLLCTYNCGGQEEADESIEQLRRFMGALPPDPEESGPSKFDKLL
jgi:hypothetical protein